MGKNKKVIRSALLVIVALVLACPSALAGPRAVVSAPADSRPAAAASSLAAPHRPTATVGPHAWGDALSGL